jgi:heptosyltransferase-2
VTRTLVIAPQWIGDAVMAEPLLATLAERGDRLTVAALPWVAPVFGAMPEVAEVVELPFAHGRLDWPARRRLAARWRDRFDVAYVLPNSLKSALVPWLARIPERVGYAAEGRSPLLSRRVAAPDGRPPMVAFYGALAPGAFDSGRRPRLRLEPALLEETTARYALQRGRYWTFAPGAEYGPAKRWPPSHYAALARSLHDIDGTPIALLGSPGEAELCEKIATQAGDACRVLAGGTSLLDAIALIAASRGLASNDSGLMHVAAAFGVPQVAVFGSTSPLHTPPLNERARVLWLKAELQLDCMPCFDRTCRFGHYLCLTSVAPDRVEQALLHAASISGATTSSVPPSRREEMGREHR